MEKELMSRMPEWYKILMKEYNKKQLRKLEGLK